MGGEAQDRTRVFGHSAGQNAGFWVGCRAGGFSCTLRRLRPVKSSRGSSLLTNDAVRLSLSVSAPVLVSAFLVLASGASGVPAALLLLVGILVSIAATHTFILQPLIDSRKTAQKRQFCAEQELLDHRTDQEFRERLERALLAAEAEPGALRTGLRAVAELMPDTEVSLLLSVPDEPRVGWQIRMSGGSLEQAVPLPHTPSCTALSSSVIAVSASSTALDACGHLHDPGGETSAICIPLHLGDRTLGSVCITCAPGEIANAKTMSRAAWAVERTGIRVAEQRLQRGPSGAGTTDPITALPGAQALRHQLRDLVRTLAPFCVGIISIDSFAGVARNRSVEQRNDSLRLMADVLCTTLRPEDLICRLDGPRFAVVLADCSAIQATAALERARESLALLLVSQENHPFTFSAGLVESHRATSLDQIVELAETATAQAQAEGGNRVVLASEPSVQPSPGTLN